MQTVAERVIARAKELFFSGEVRRVLGWERGEFQHERIPALYETAEQLEKLVYDEYCGPNLSKELIALSKLEGRTLAILKPCDARSLNLLLREYRVDREKVYILGAGCTGMRGRDGLLLKCETCRGKDFPVFDEAIDDEECRKVPDGDRFADVCRIEQMSGDERFLFFRSELSKCIRCNACRNICPACSCNQCVFDNPDSGVASKASADPFEDSQFHIVRAFHVAGRCTDCGECSRACPQGIPLHLLNRKIIKDIGELYGEYEPGGRSPLIDYRTNDVLDRGESHA